VRVRLYRKVTSRSCSFIPKLPACGAETLPRRHARYAAKSRASVMRAREVVVGNADVQVVDVVEAGAGGEELQELREFQIGAPA
jgi:hypothetical protein